VSRLPWNAKSPLRVRKTLGRSDALNAIEKLGSLLAFVLDVSTVSS
jgi:hypothetical protein